MPDEHTEGSARPITRLTMPMLMILSVLLQNERAFGLQIADATGLGVGTVYPILARLAAANWIAVLETRDSPGSKRGPGAPKKFYTLTAEGIENARRATEKLRKAAEARSTASDTASRGLGLPSHLQPRSTYLNPKGQ